MQDEQCRQQAAEEQSRHLIQGGGIPHVQNHVLGKYVEPRHPEYHCKREENHVRRQLRWQGHTRISYSVGTYR